MTPERTILVTPQMMKALSVPMPNVHKLWQEYATSAFRRDWLKAWAGDDTDKQRAVQTLLDEI